MDLWPEQVHAIDLRLARRDDAAANVDLQLLRRVAAEQVEQVGIRLIDEQRQLRHSGALRSVPPAPDVEPGRRIPSGSLIGSGLDRRAPFDDAAGDIHRRATRSQLDHRAAIIEVRGRGDRGRAHGNVAGAARTHHLKRKLHGVLAASGEREARHHHIGQLARQARPRLFVNRGERHRLRCCEIGPLDDVVVGGGIAAGIGLAAGHRSHAERRHPSGKHIIQLHGALQRSHLRHLAMAGGISVPFAEAVGVRDHAVRQLADVKAGNQRRQRQVPVAERRSDRRLPLGRKAPQHFVCVAWFCECHFVFSLLLSCLGSHGT